MRSTMKHFYMNWWQSFSQPLEHRHHGLFITAEMFDKTSNTVGRGRLRKCKLASFKYSHSWYALRWEP